MKNFRIAISDLRFLLCALCVLCGFAASAQDRVIARTNDLRFAAAPQDLISWNAGESIEYDIFARYGSRAITISNSAVCIWYVADQTLTNYFVMSTGTVVDATNGFVRFTLAPQFSALTSRTYQSAAIVYFQSPTNPAHQVTIDRTSAQVQKNFSYFGVYRGPVFATNGVLDGNTAVFPTFWTANATSIFNVISNMLPAGGGGGGTSGVSGVTGQAAHQLAYTTNGGGVVTISDTALATNIAARADSNLVWGTFAQYLPLGGGTMSPGDIHHVSLLTFEAPNTAAEPVKLSTIGSGMTGLHMQNAVLTNSTDVNFVPWTHSDYSAYQDGDVLMFSGPFIYAAPPQIRTNQILIASNGIFFAAATAVNFANPSSIAMSNGTATVTMANAVLSLSKTGAVAGAISFAGTGVTQTNNVFNFSVGTGALFSVNGTNISQGGSFQTGGGAGTFTNVAIGTNSYTAQALIAGGSNIAFRTLSGTNYADVSGTVPEASHATTAGTASNAMTLNGLTGGSLVSNYISIVGTGWITVTTTNGPGATNYAYVSFSGAQSSPAFPWVFSERGNGTPATTNDTVAWSWGDLPRLYPANIGTIGYGWQIPTSGTVQNATNVWTGILPPLASNLTKCVLDVLDSQGTNQPTVSFFCIDGITNSFFGMTNALATTNAWGTITNALPAGWIGAQGLRWWCTNIVASGATSSATRVQAFRNGRFQ